MSIHTDEVVQCFGFRKVLRFEIQFRRQSIVFKWWSIILVPKVCGRRRLKGFWNLDKIRHRSGSIVDSRSLDVAVEYDGEDISINRIVVQDLA